MQALATNQMHMVNPTHGCFNGLAGFPGWSKWSSADRTLYDTRFHTSHDEYSYENNFGYVQQECRYDAWKFIADNLLVTVCSRSETSEFAFILPTVGSQTAALAVLDRLCGQVREVCGRRVVLRKCSRLVLDALLNEGSFRIMPPEEYANPRELPEDIFPQVILDVTVSALLVGSCFVKTRNNIRNAKKHYDIEFCDLNEKNAANAVQVAHTWAKAYKARVANSASPAMIAVDGTGADPCAYTVFPTAMASLVDNRHYFGRLMILDGTPSGFCFSGRTASNTAASYASLCISSIRGTSELMIADTLQLLVDRGIAYFNLGGSESQGLFNYKRKWGAHALRSTFELEFTGR